VVSLFNVLPLPHSTELDPAHFQQVMGYSHLEGSNSVGRSPSDWTRRGARGRRRKRDDVAFGGVSEHKRAVHKQPHHQHARHSDLLDLWFGCQKNIAALRAETSRAVIQTGMDADRQRQERDDARDNALRRERDDLLRRERDDALRRERDDLLRRERDDTMRQESDVMQREREKETRQALESLRREKERDRADSCEMRNVLTLFMVVVFLLNGFCTHRLIGTQGHAFSQTSQVSLMSTALVAQPWQVETVALTHQVPAMPSEQVTQDDQQMTKTTPYQSPSWQEAAVPESSSKQEATVPESASLIKVGNQASTPEVSEMEAQNFLFMLVILRVAFFHAHGTSCADHGW
jgi:hypothetical protein